MSQTRWREGALLGLLLLTGCNRGGLDATVTGKVTVDDRDAPIGMVTFYPADEDPNRPTPTGQIGPGGVYILKTGAKEGLPSGDYRVGVQVMDTPPPLKDNQPPASLPLSPPRYGNPKTSGFEFTVEPGSNEINLPVKGR
jgi:hypothetical protein